MASPEEIEAEYARRFGGQPNMGYPALAKPTAAREAGAQAALEQTTGIRRQKTGTEKAVGVGLDLALGGLGAAGGAVGGLPGIMGGGAAGIALSDVIQQEYERRQGLRENYDPWQTGIQTGAAALTPLALGGVSRAAAGGGGIVSGGAPMRGISELEKANVPRGIKLLTRPFAATPTRASTAETLFQGIEGHVANLAGAGSRKLPEVIAGEEAAARATQAGKYVDISPTLERLMSFIPPTVQEETQQRVGDKLLALAAKYERLAKGGTGPQATLTREVTPTQALDMLRELRTPVAGAFESGEGSLYQRGLKYAQHDLETKLKESLDPVGKLAFLRSSARLKSIENLQERITGPESSNVLRNLWKKGGERALEALKEYDKQNKTTYVKQTYDLAIRDELNPSELGMAHKLIQSILPIVGNVWLTGARGFAKTIAFITRPSGPIAAAGVRYMRDYAPAEKPKRYGAFSR